MQDRQLKLNKALVVHPFEKKAPKGYVYTRDPESCLEEARGLALAIDLEIRFEKLIPLSKINPSTYIGQGVVDELSHVVQQEGIHIAIFDTTLTPVQQRNLEIQLKCKVIDRTGLILEIFGARARTREGILQVELAFLMHRRSRLVRAWTHLERQRGGFGFTGGPGESQMELDRRMIDTKIMKIEKELEQVKRTRKLHRGRRKRSEVPLIALVGYTNAGKSTLFNKLTQCNVLAEDLLFATLDPTIRPLKLPNGRTVLICDTVGFISNLPTQLVAAFRATLEEVQDSTLILHVRDAANPDHEVQKQDVMVVLEQLNIDCDTPLAKPSLLEVFNKIDSIDGESKKMLQGVAQRDDHLALISAHTGEGIEDLLFKIQKSLLETSCQYHLELPLENGGPLLSWCYRQGVIETRTNTEEGCTLILNLTSDQKEYLLSQFSSDINLITLAPSLN